MNTGAIAVSLFLCLSAATLSAQEQQSAVPQGWRVIPMPIVCYNSDLGFQFGANSDIYNYGTGPSLYPKYLHKFHVEACYSTKGQTLANIDYDSEHLIPGVRVSASATAQIDPLYNFFGFNGDVTTYDRKLDRHDGVAYYCYRRSLFRFRSIIQGQIAPKLKWVGGMSFWYILNEDLNLKGYQPDNTLFHSYRTSGIIRDDEVKGGFFEFTGGLSLDTRDFEPSPTKGIWAEAYFVGAPDILHTGYSYLKFCARFRHYFTPGPEWLTFAYNLAYQGTIAGEAPYYMQQNIYSLLTKQAVCEGLGGLNTVRGVMGCRLLGNDYAWANFEIRCRIIDGTLLGMNWYIALNPFFDLGIITRPFRIKEMSAVLGRPEDELTRLACSLHKSAGLGIKIGLDRNYILSLEVGKSFSNNDGPVCISTAINYIF